MIRKHQKDETNKELNEALKKLIAIEKKRALEVEDSVVLEKKIEPVQVEKPKVVKPRKAVLPQHNNNKKEAKVGSRVKIPGYNKTGEVQSIKGDTAEILIGTFKVKAKLKDLEVFS